VLYFEGELLAPPLLITLVLGETLALQRWWQRGGWATAIVAGVLLGLFALALPNALSLVPVVWLWQWWVARRRRQRGGLSAALLGLPLGLVLTIAPATIRNAVVAGDFVPITANGGVNLYIGNNPEADGCTARIPILAELAPLQGWTCFDQPAIARGVERLAGRRLRASEVSTFFADKALAYAAEHPAATLALAARKAALFWGPIEVANNRELEIARAESTTLRWLPGFPWLLSLALVGAAWLVCARRAAGEPARAFALLLGAATLVFFATHLPFFVAGRYRLPLYPFLLLFGACGVHGVLGLVRERRRGAAALWTGSWLALLVLAHVPLTDYRPDRSAWHFQLGGAWRMAGQPERAAAEYRLALAAAARPFPVASNNLGAVLLQLGETAAGIEQLRLALRHAPDYAEARYNLALALASGGRDDLAAVEFEHALRVTPDDAVTHVALAASLLRLRRPAEALGHVGHAMQHGDRAPRTRCLYAIALLEMGRSQEAVAELQSVRREHPGFVNAYLLLVDAAMQQGDRGRAREIVEQGLRAVPGHPGLEAWRERLR
jgi:Tfp pilus assembly protein PilF